MTGLLLFNALMILFGVGIATGFVPANMLAGAIRVMHITFGITVPPPDKIRLIALIWTGTLIVFVDGLLFLFTFLTTQMK